MSVPQIPAPGELVAGRYRIIRQLGAGGFGVVFQARQEAIGRDVAIKFLHPKANAQPQEVERFRREVFHASSLSHPNSITVHDYGQTPQGLCYLVMEYLEGQNLQQWLSTRGPMPYSTAFEVLEQVLGSLAEAHSHGIVHRDLKLENIFWVERPGAQARVKLLDFGLAKYVGDAQGRYASLTAKGVVNGTPQYMSPEQAYGQPVGPASDVYSTGLIAWELLTARQAYHGQTAMEIMLKQVSEPLPELPRSLQKTDLARFVAIATQKKAEDRFPDAATALEWLQSPRAWPPDARQDDASAMRVMQVRTRATAMPSKQQLADNSPAPVPSHSPTAVNPAAVAPEGPGVRRSPAPAMLITDFAPPQGPPGPQSPRQAQAAHEKRDQVRRASQLELRLNLAQMPLIGRETEMQRLHAFAELARRQGGVAWICGEDGCGKSRLVREWLAREHFPHVLRGRFPQKGRMHQGLLEAFAPLLQSPAEEPGLAAIVALARELIAHLELPGHAEPERADGAALDPALDLMEAILTQLAHRGPTALVLDDVHHGEARTARLIARLEERLGQLHLPLAVVLVGDAQASREEPWMRRLLHEQGDAPLAARREHIELGAISPQAATELVGRLLPGIGHQHWQSLPQAARHNPLYLEHWAALQVDEDLAGFHANTQQWHFQSLPQATPVEDIPSLHKLLLQRTRNFVSSHPMSAVLGPLLLRMALVGVQFDKPLVRRLLRHEHRPELEASLSAALDALCRVGILRQVNQEATPLYELGRAGLRIAFIQDFTTDREARRTLHAHIARMLAEDFAQLGARAGATGATPLSPTALAHEIAWHWSMAGQRTESGQWWHMAARQAEREGDLHAALTAYHHAATAMESLPGRRPPALTQVRLGQSRIYQVLAEYPHAEDALRSALVDVAGRDDAHQTTRMYESLAEILLIQARYEEAQALYEDVREAAHARQDGATVARAELGLGDIARSKGHPALGRMYFERALQGARQLQEVKVELAAVLGVGRSAYASGEWQAAYRIFDEVRERALQLGHLTLQGEALLELGTVAIYTHGMPQAEGFIAQGLRLKRQSGDMLGQARGHLWMASCLRRTNRLDEARHHLGLARSISERLAHNHTIARCMIVQAELAWASGDMPQAKSAIQEAHQMASDQGDAMSVGDALIFRALVEIHCGHMSEARSDIATAMAMGRTPQTSAGHSPWRASGLLYTGLAHEAEGQLSQALEAYARAREVGRAGGQREVETYATVALAKLHMALGNLEEARLQIPLGLQLSRELHQAYALQLALAASAWMARMEGNAPELERSLGELRAQSQRPHAPNVQLSMRLTEVARVIATTQRGHDARNALRAVGEILASLGESNAVGAVRTLAQQLRD